MTERLLQVMQMNPEFAEALQRGERWAVQYAEQVNGLDGKSDRRHPDRVFDGKRRNWCGSCPHQEGCAVCDLDGDHLVAKHLTGYYDF